MRSWTDWTAHKEQFIGGLFTGAGLVIGAGIVVSLLIGVGPLIHRIGG